MADFEFDPADPNQRHRWSSPGYQAPSMPQPIPNGLPSSPQQTATNASGDTYSVTNEQFDPSKVPAGVDLSWAQQFANQRSAGAPVDYHRMAEQFAGRNQPTSGGGSSAPRSAFSDPVGGPVNEYANERFERLRNPPGGSGQALLEDALKRMSAQFQSGGYTPTEMEQFQTQAIDPLERLRTARKQQVAQQLSQRGIAFNPAAPQGVAKAMMDDIDRQFDALRSQQQTQIGTQAANETRARMLQALEMLSGLASTEEGRLDKAFNYRTVPLGLADRSFNQAMQVYGQANPMNLFNPAMMLANMGQGQQSGQQNALANLAWLLLNGGGR